MCWHDLYVRIFFSDKIMKFVFLTSLLYISLHLHGIHGDPSLDDVMARMDAMMQEQRAMKSEIAELRESLEGQCVLSFS